MLKIRTCIIVGALLFIPLVAFKLFTVYREGMPKEVANNQAIWIARYWNPERTINEICDDASRNLKKPINPKEWKVGGEGILVIGPTVSGEQIFIADDLSINWISIDRSNK